MIIAVDFDGTIVEHNYPKIGKEIPFAIATLKKLQAEHHLLILWTVREGGLLQEAVDYCRRRGLEFYAVCADMYIDDCNVGTLPDWGAIYEMVHNHWSHDEYRRQLHESRYGEKHKTSFWKRLTGNK